MGSNERSVRHESSRKFFFTCDVVYMPEGLNDVSNLHIVVPSSQLQYEARC